MDAFSPKLPRLALFTTLILGAGLLPLSSPAEDIHLDMVSTGAMKDIGAFMPQQVILSPQRPPAIKKAPAGLLAPLYGVFKMGPAESPTTFAVVLDEPTGKPTRLWVDANGKGDFSDASPVLWEVTPGHGRDGQESKPGREITCYEGGATVNVAYGAQAMPLHLVFYRNDKSDPRQRPFKNSLFYYADYAREGNIIFGDKPYKALLWECLASGDFRGRKGAMLIHGKPFAGIRLLVDLNGDGRYDFRSGELFDAMDPIEIHGTTYHVTGLTASGDSFQLEKAGK
jgi:hypothetical protein